MCCSAAAHCVWRCACCNVICVFVAHCRHEVERRTHPLSHDDFELLSSELEAWRQQQTAAIKAAAAAAAEQQQQEQQVCEKGFVGSTLPGA